MAVSMEEGALAEFFQEDCIERRDFDGRSLHVYSKPGRPKSNRLVVLIHGFGGEGYGTWRGIPDLLLQSDELAADVALFDYVSGHRKSFNDSPAIESIVDALTDELEDLPHQSVFLVGHSMGGVIAMSVVRETYMRLLSETGAIDRFRGVFTLATPLAGSRWSPVQLPIREGRALSIHSELQRANAQFFANQVCTERTPVERFRFWIPHFAAKASGDRWVDRFSSTSSIPSDRSRTFKGGHSSFLEVADVGNWLATQFVQIEQTWRKLTQSNRAQPAFRAQFQGHPSHGEWMDSYQAALGKFGDDENLRVEDLSGQQIQEPIELRVRVLKCGEPPITTDTSVLKPDLELHDRSLVRALGISLFGPAPEVDAQTLAQALIARSNTWVASTKSVGDLHQEIFNWLKRVHKLGPVGDSGLGRSNTTLPWSRHGPMHKDLEAFE